MEITPCFQSWTLGYIKSWFTDLAIKENYGGKYRTTNKDAPGILISDDEVFQTVENAKSLLKIIDPQKDIILFKTEKFYEYFLNQGIKCLYVPFLDIYDDCIALQKINFEIPLIRNNKINYFCLNRNSEYARSYLVDTLHENNLIKYGYVTWNDANNQIKKSLPGLIYDADLSHYTSSAAGFERNNRIMIKIPCSSNVANYFYISKNIPGTVSVMAETYIHNFFPTEKSFLFLFTKRVPIVLAEPFRIKLLEEQGFDVFRDIVNHDYDLLDSENYQNKIQSAVVSNKQLLIEGVGDSVDHRFNKNFKYLIKDWLPKELNNLKNSIESLM